MRCSASWEMRTRAHQPTVWRQRRVIAVERFLFGMPASYAISTNLAATVLVSPGGFEHHGFLCFHGLQRGHGHSGHDRRAGEKSRWNYDAAARDVDEIIFHLMGHFLGPGEEAHFATVNSRKSMSRGVGHRLRARSCLLHNTMKRRHFVLTHREALGGGGNKDCTRCSEGTRFP